MSLDSTLLDHRSLYQICFVKERNIDHLKDWWGRYNVLKAIPRLGKKHTQVFIFRPTLNIFGEGEIDSKGNIGVN